MTVSLTLSSKAAQRIMDYLTAEVLEMQGVIASLAEAGISQSDGRSRGIGAVGAARMPARSASPGTGPRPIASSILNLSSSSLPDDVLDQALEDEVPEAEVAAANDAHATNEAVSQADRTAAAARKPVEKGNLRGKVAQLRTVPGVKIGASKWNSSLGTKGGGKTEDADTSSEE